MGLQARFSTALINVNTIDFYQEESAYSVNTAFEIIKIIMRYFPMIRYPC